MVPTLSDERYQGSRKIDTVAAPWWGAPFSRSWYPGSRDFGNRRRTRMAARNIVGPQMSERRAGCTAGTFCGLTPGNTRSRIGRHVARRGLARSARRVPFRPCGFRADAPNPPRATTAGHSLTAWRSLPLARGEGRSWVAVRQRRAEIASPRVGWADARIALGPRGAREGALHGHRLLPRRPRRPQAGRPAGHRRLHDRAGGLARSGGHPRDRGGPRLAPRDARSSGPASGTSAKRQGHGRRDARPPRHRRRVHQDRGAEHEEVARGAPHRLHG